MTNAAKQGDKVRGTDVHIVMIPSPNGAVPTPVPMPFSGDLVDGLSPDVRIENKAAAVAGSKATNSPAHVPSGGPFQKPPSNEGSVISGSATVRINNKSAARDGDPALTCNDPADAPNGTVSASSTVRIG